VRTCDTINKAALRHDAQLVAQQPVHNSVDISSQAIHHKPLNPLRKNLRSSAQLLAQLSSLIAE
jgi:hypothetical protein